MVPGLGWNHFLKRFRPLFGHIFWGGPEPSTDHFFTMLFGGSDNIFSTIFWAFLQFLSVEPAALIKPASWMAGTLAGQRTGWFAGWLAACPHVSPVL